MNRDRENLKAGVFVAAGVLLSIVVVFVLADFGWLFEQKQSIGVYFQLSDGLQGLKEGAPVTLGDQPIGEVIVITDRVEVGDGDAVRVVGKVVTAEIPKRYDLYQNAIIELKAPLIGSGTTLNVRSVGDGSLYDGRTPIDGRVAGSAQVQELVREAGIDQPQREQIRSIIASVESIAATLREDVPAITGTAKQVLADGRAIATDLKSTAAQLTQMMDSVNESHAVWLERIDRVTSGADESIAAVRTMIDQTGPQVRGAVENIHGLTATARDKTMVQLTGALDKASQVLEDLRIASSQIKTLVVGQRPVIERALANARLTSDQLKLAAIEVRRSPWRLLYEPDDRQLNTDNVYDAARSFALAAGVLDTTAENLRALVDGQVADQHRVEKILDHLETVFAKFKDVEAAFWQAIASNRIDR